MNRVVFIVVVLLLLGSALAQVPVAPEYQDRVQHTFDTLPKKNSLDCTISAWQPTLDFAFRFVSGYMFECPLRQFDNARTDLAGYIRVLPQGGKAVFLTDSYHTPPVRPEVLKKIDLRKAHIDLGASGVFAVGEGEYAVDVLIVDQRGRFFHKNWRIRANHRRGQLGVSLSLPPNQVSHVGRTGWDGRLVQAGKGRRVTILLDAASIRPGQANLRAWDRALLLQLLTAVLQQVPCESVRLVAFNLDQQREIFRKEHFDREGYDELVGALHSLELGTVSYKAIQRDHATELLVQLANQEINAEDPSDTVIFLGPSTLINQKTPEALLAPTEGRRPNFYYLEFFPFPGGFPDAIHNLVKVLHGAVFELHSPADLAKAIPKMTADAPARQSASKGFDAPASQ